MSRTLKAITSPRSLASGKGDNQTMKAVRIHKYGGPEVLQSEDLPRPQVSAATEVLIRVHAAGVNPVDSAIRRGLVKEIFPVSLPWIQGSDVSGVIEEIGPDVTRFKKGDEVFALLNPAKGGAYAEYVVVSESELALKPKSLHHIRAAAVPVAAVTAWNALFETAQLQSGQRVLIHGGAGGVGHFAVQLAKRKGAHVIATASAKNHELVYELGADEVIDYHAQKTRRAQDRHRPRFDRRRHAGTFLESFEEGRSPGFDRAAVIGGKSKIRWRSRSNGSKPAGWRQAFRDRKNH